MYKPLVKQNKWLYPVLYVVFIIISMFPVYTEKPYPPQKTQNVIMSLLKVSTTPYRVYAPILMGRVLSGYMGFNYLIIALAQGMGTTTEYGFIIHTGGMVMSGLLGLVWLIVAFRDELHISFKSFSWHHLMLLPLALIAIATNFTRLRSNILFYDSCFFVFVDTLFSIRKCACI